MQSVQDSEASTQSSNPLVDRLIRLVFTLPFSTTIERAFSAMKLVKTRLCKKMKNEFLSDCLTVYIEEKIANHK
jgi:ribosomal protein L31E